MNKPPSAAAAAGATSGVRRAGNDDWHRRDVPDVLAALGSGESGLADSDAADRLARLGPNELRDRGGKSPLLILWEQVTAVMVLILVGASGLSLVLGKFFEAGSILAIVVLFTLLGFFQEYRAERAIAALKRLSVPSVRVRREGRACQVSARVLVPGDVVLLEAGSVVPADIRVIESANLRVQEAALTGESEPVEKHVEAIRGAETAIGDRRNMAYMGTQVTYGRGAGIVVATGMSTQLGRIADLLQDVVHALTPLQGRLDSLGKRLAAAGLAVALVLMGMGVLAGEGATEMVLTAISVAVAVIPEGLPAVVTFTLALGAQRMLRRNALIRKLPAVETLGSVTVICSDKTGTLTENRMTVTAMDVPGRHTVLGAGPERFTVDGAGALLLLGSALCNDAELSGEGQAPVVIGDPTEGALLTAAGRAGLDYVVARAALPRVGELPFDSSRKRMTTVHTVAAASAPPFVIPAALLAGAPYLAVTKGAVDGLLDVSAAIWMDDSVVPFDESLQRRTRDANDALAREGMRVLGVAVRPLHSPEMSPELERDLVLVGLVGMIDPPRAEVKAAVATCVAAGIRPVMITGDHPLTAVSIARQLGITRDGLVVTGVQLEEMNQAELDDVVAHASVFARVSPEDKLRIVASLQRRGEVVAMTGDGVNDAPALKKADIGVAMGITGTDVSKEAADMVLRDDNFATIVAAVEEGRVIYDNLRRFVGFAVAGNIGKVMVMLLWPALFLVTGLDVGEDAAAALLPLQLLWLNLMTDGLLGLSLGAERAEADVMRRKPHAPSDGIFSGGLGLRTAWVGVLIGATALGVGYVYYRMDEPQWQTMMFTTLAFLQVFQAVAVRSNTQSLLGLGLLSNRVMVAAVAVVVFLQLTVLYAPFLSEEFFKLEALGPRDLAICGILGSLSLVAIEGEETIRRRRAGGSERRATNATRAGG